MKKQTTIAFLVKHLDHWPKRLGGAPVIDGWRWCKSDDGLFLFDNYGVDCETVEQLKINREEWVIAQLNDIAPTMFSKPKQKIYIAGPMTGRENANRKAFNTAASWLSMKGYIVLNPAILPDGLSQKEYMQIDIAMIQCCDAIYLLDGWEDSKGANAECSLAEKLGLKIILESE
tara:strand:+ start:702 stop:1223 length:522 start_codon:yes stop_codon:yes gene_type:complete